MSFLFLKRLNFVSSSKRPRLKTFEMFLLITRIEIEMANQKRQTIRRQNENVYWITACTFEWRSNLRVPVWKSKVDGRSGWDVRGEWRISKKQKLLRTTNVKYDTGRRGLVNRSSTICIRVKVFEYFFFYILIPFWILFDRHIRIHCFSYHSFCSSKHIRFFLISNRF